MEMRTRTEATADDLARVPENGKAELVDGRLVLMSPAGGFHGNASLKIVMSLYEYSRRTGVGHALGDNVGFLVTLPHRKSFCPDAAFFLGPLKKGFLDGPPVFAVEVRSDSDESPKGHRAMADKRRDYFDAGTLVVWDVDLFGEIVVRSYRAEAPDKPETYLRGQLANAEPAVPGWWMPVDDLLS
jgi:Uma2 family endonuclease